MENEKMMILKMLEQGKISAEEASKLLAAANGEKVKPSKVKNENNEYKTNTNTNTNTNSGYTNNSYTNNSNTSNRQSSYSSRDFAAEFSKKFETLAKDIEPKIHKITEVIAEKTTSVADMISKSISDSTTEKNFPKPSNSTSFEAIISGSGNELSLSGFNGDISLKGYNGDKISGTIFYKSRKYDANIKFMKMGNKYFIDYDEDDFEKVCIDVLIPEKLFRNVSVQTINSPISLDTLQCGNLSVNDSNADIILKNIIAENIHVEGNNGKLIIKNISSDDASFENFGGEVEFMEVDISKLKLNTFNSPTVIYISDFRRYNDYMWLIEGSNGKLKLNLPTTDEVGYHIKASTSLSNVKIGLTGLSYISNSTNYAEAKSIKYDDAYKTVRLVLETSNAPLIVN